MDRCLSCNTETPAADLEDGTCRNCHETNEADKAAEVARKATVKIKPHPEQIGIKEVFRNGQKVAEYDFCRDVRQRNNRIDVRTSGTVWYTDGTISDLRLYAWDRDVQRDFRNGVL